MTIRALITLSAALWTAVAVAADTKAEPDLRSILVVLAHPDDETVIAPLLGTMCLERGSQCSFLVLTRGEGGTCSLPGGCPDLGAIREREMRSAAAFFKASVTIWALPDVFGDVAAAWSAASGGRDELRKRIQKQIDLTRPTTVVTFDPAHGTTGHPAHQAVGQLVIEAAGPTRVLLIESGAELKDGRYRFFNARPDIASAFEAPGAWTYLIANVSIHASQFDSDILRSFCRTPLDQRHVYLAPATRAMPR